MNQLAPPSSPDLKLMMSTGFFRLWRPHLQPQAPCPSFERPLMDVCFHKRAPWGLHSARPPSEWVAGGAESAFAARARPPCPYHCFYPVWLTAAGGVRKKGGSGHEMIRQRDNNCDCAW